MTQAQHTPGPWKLQRLDLYESGESGTGWEVIGSNNETVCNNQTYYPHAVSLPDACLIAAAPELLEALLKVEAFKVRYRKNADMDEIVNALSSQFEALQLQASIAIALVSPQGSEVGKSV